MFSGIVEEIGIVKVASHLEGKSVFVISCVTCLQDVKIGDSIAVNGTCLTVIEYDDTTFKVEAIPETLNLTNLKSLNQGHKVNLERSITMSTRIGGHYVQGHIDGTTTIERMETQGDSCKVWFEKPSSHKLCFIPKGYIAIDGMSLTVVDVSEKYFSICFIPHTQDVTIVKSYAVGTRVNFEIDNVAKTIVQLFENYRKDFIK